MTYIDRKDFSRRSSLSSGAFRIRARSVDQLAAIFLALIYFNAAYFRASSLLYLCYFGFVAAALIKMAGSRRHIFEWLGVAVVTLANRNLIFGYLAYFGFGSKNGTSSTFDRDLDIRLFVILCFIATIVNFSIGNVAFFPSFGFVGRLELGFFHPNMMPTVIILSYYLCKTYVQSKLVKTFSFLAASGLILLSGSAGAILPILTLAISTYLFPWRRLVYPAFICLVVSVSLWILTSHTWEMTLLSSGRNVVFQDVVNHMDLSNLFVPVSNEALTHSAGIRNFFDTQNSVNRYTEAVPYDGIVIAAMANAPIFVILFFVITGIFRTPETQRDFDRLMLFWAFGFTLNPISIWSPFYFLALRRSLRN